MYIDEMDIIINMYIYVVYIYVVIIIIIWWRVYLWHVYLWYIYINNELYIDVCQSTPSRCEYLWTSCECIVDASRCE